MTLNDFYPDPVMLRRIKRVQAREMQSDEEDDDEVDADGDNSMRVTQERSIKAERGKDRGRELIEAMGDD